MQSSPYPVAPPNAWQYGMTVVPITPVQIFPSTTTLTKMYVANTTASAVTLTVTDRSAENSGSPCQIYPSVSVPANSVQVVDFGGVTANYGVIWFASTANALHAWLRGAN